MFEIAVSKLNDIQEKRKQTGHTEPWWNQSIILKRRNAENSEENKPGNDQNLRNNSNSLQQKPISYMKVIIFLKKTMFIHQILAVLKQHQ